MKRRRRLSICGRIRTASGDPQALLYRRILRISSMETLKSSAGKGAGLTGFFPTFCKPPYIISPLFLL
jgi:hypothetical protein